MAKHIATHAEYDKLTRYYREGIKNDCQHRSYRSHKGAGRRRSLRVAARRKDYRDALALVDYLIENDDENPLIDFTAAKLPSHE